MEMTPSPDSTAPEACPFCGKAPFAYEQSYSGKIAPRANSLPSSIHVECHTDDCPIYGKNFKLAAWNTRATRQESGEAEAFLALVMHNFDGGPRGELWQQYRAKFPGSYERHRAAAMSRKEGGGE